MLFMVMHKLHVEVDKNAPVPKELVANMGKLINETIQAGRFHNGAGLLGSAYRVRVKFEGGEVKTQKGPYRGENELVVGLAMLKVKTMEEAVGWGTKLGRALGDVEVEVGQVTEPWDIGVAPKPSGELPLHVLLLDKATPAYEAGKSRAPEHEAKLRALHAEMKQAGVLLTAEELKPTSTGARLHASKGKHTWTDGPFAESKELVSGFSIIKVDSKQEAQAWAERYADILGDIEVDVRPVVER